MSGCNAIAMAIEQASMTKTGDRPRLELTYNQPVA